VDVIAMVISGLDNWNMMDWGNDFGNIVNWSYNFVSDWSYIFSNNWGDFDDFLDGLWYLIVGWLAVDDCVESMTFI
jgi:hypothetical protein